MRANIRQNGYYRAALYMRLSKDDEGPVESASISAQRKMLSAYANERGFTVVDEYIDDGWSGTSFDRPGFKRMIDDIEAKKINMVITKDFSRLGRDYITSGQFTEMYFPERNVRYIAINDGYDSANPYYDIAPFKHVVNEMYARDTSRKIRSAFQTKMQEGSFIGNFAPYGYMKDPDNKNHLIVDPGCANVVCEIFQMAENGQRPSEIAYYLNKSGIASPAVYRCSSRPHLNVDFYSTRKEWTSSTVCKILRNIVYLGHMAQGKTLKPSFKSKAASRLPAGEWYIVENTHEPLVSADTFDSVRKRSISRRRQPKTAFQNIFSGIAKCADCGANMSGSRKKEAAYNLACGRYKLYGSKECSNHFIDYDLIYNFVLSEAREMLALSENEKKPALEHEQKIGGIDELTPELVKKLIDRIEVKQGVWGQTPEGKRKNQEIEIFWRFTGGTEPTA